MLHRGSVCLTRGFVKRRVYWGGGGGEGAQSRRLLKPGLGRSHLRIFVSKWQRS